MNGIKARLVALAASILVAPMAFANSSADIAELEQKLKAMDEQVGVMSHNLIDENQWFKVASRLAKENFEEQSLCSDATKQLFAGKYALTFDEEGNPCRIYDLSFPTLETLFRGRPVSKLPIQSFKARDYLNWIKGDYEAVLGKVASFNESTSSMDMASWVEDIRFKPHAVMNLAEAGVVEQTGLPKSFKASDLEYGDRFEFPSTVKDELAKAMDQLSTGPQPLSFEEQKAWKALIENPEKLLAQIQFDWNEFESVYDIFIEGEFLPIRGPIALVDYSANHKLLVERLLRNVAQRAFQQLVRFVPAPAQQIIGLAINDAFISIEMAYEYQMNQLEGTLRAADSGELQISVAQPLVDRSINVLFGARADVIQLYVTAATRGLPFDWKKLEVHGRTARYALEKNRDIMMNNMHSFLVLNKGCEVKIVHNYFGECTRAEKLQTHSLISQSKVLFWNLNAPVIFNHERSSQVALLRSTAYLLSVGARMLDLPIVKYLSGVLSDALQTYARAGILDESFLRNDLYLKKLERGSLKGTEASMYKYLYIQNINPFLPKSESFEQRVIKANVDLMEKN